MNDKTIGVSPRVLSVKVAVNDLEDVIEANLEKGYMVEAILPGVYGTHTMQSLATVSMQGKQELQSVLLVMIKNFDRHQEELHIAVGGKP